MKKGFFLGICLVLFLTGCSVNPDLVTKEQDNEVNTEEFIYIKYDVDVSDKVKLGNAEAENEIVLAFDFNCPGCHQWFEKILPQVKDQFIQTGVANYTGQPLPLLSQSSIELTRINDYIEKNLPAQLYDFQLNIVQDSPMKMGASSEYIQSLLKEYEINKPIEDVRKESSDIITLAEYYTKDLAVQKVPTLYVNGIMLNNAFDLQEISKVINGDIKENDAIQVLVKK